MMKKTPLLIQSFVLLNLSSMASYAADPDGGTCTVIKQALAQSSYDIIVFDEQAGELAPYLKQSIQETQQSYPDELGSVNFNIVSIASSEEMSNYATSDHATYYVCANSSSVFCNQNSPTAMTLNTEWSKIPNSEEVRTNAAEHIARASVSMIQRFEAGKAQGAVGESAILPRMHLLSD